MDNAREFLDKMAHARRVTKEKMRTGNLSMPEIAELNRLQNALKAACNTQQNDIKLVQHTGTREIVPVGEHLVNDYTRRGYVNITDTVLNETNGGN